MNGRARACQRIALVVAQQGQAIGRHGARDLGCPGVDLDVAGRCVGGHIAQPPDAPDRAKGRVRGVGRGENGGGLAIAGVERRIDKHPAAGRRRIEGRPLEDDRAIGGRDRRAGRVNAVIGRCGTGCVARQGHRATGGGDRTHIEIQTIRRPGIAHQVDVTGCGDGPLPCVLPDAVVPPRTRDGDGTGACHDRQTDVGSPPTGVVVQAIHHDVAGVRPHALGGGPAIDHRQVEANALHRDPFEGDIAAGTQGVGGTVEGDAPRNACRARTVVDPPVGIPRHRQVAVETADDLVGAPHQNAVAIPRRAVHAGRRGIGINRDVTVSQDGVARGVHSKAGPIGVGAGGGGVDGDGAPSRRRCGAVARHNATAIDIDAIAAAGGDGDVAAC